MFIGDVVNSGAIPALEATMRFAGARHRVIAHNIANLATPNFRSMDASPAAFQKQLAAAIDRRRAETGGKAGELRMESTREVQVGPGGGLTLVPRTSRGGILAQDRNNADLERLMQDHAENAAAYRVASELLRNKLQQLRDAIGERV